MYTSIVLVALMGSVDIKSTWQTDYSEAQKRGTEEKKPLAVVIGRGPSGWEAVSSNGKLDPSVAEALQNYVCVYVDSSTERGQKLADAFQMKNGLVISDHSGDKQAFRHEGTLTNGELEGTLRRFADPSRVVTRTETTGRIETRFYPYDAPAGTAVPSYLVPSGGSYCPSCRGR